MAMEVLAIDYGCSSRMRIGSSCHSDTDRGFGRVTVIGWFRMGSKLMLMPNAAVGLIVLARELLSMRLWLILNLFFERLAVAIVFLTLLEAPALLQRR